MVGCLLDNLFALEELVGHQLTVVVLKASQHIRHGVVDWIFVLLWISMRYASSNVATIFCTRACSTPVTSRNRLTLSVCAIHMLELAWPGVSSGMTSRPG